MVVLDSAVKALRNGDTCFNCQYYAHLNPDDDYCILTNRIVTVFTPMCLDAKPVDYSEIEDNADRN